MRPYNIVTDFTLSKDHGVSSAASHSHKVQRGKMKDSEKVWINKEMKDPSVARIEILAQEFFRLIIPHQPETRLAINYKTNTHYILSEEVSGYHMLPESEADNFTNGTYKGLGQALLCSMFLQEVDLKNGNIGLDDKNQVIKIDGDWCFTQINEGWEHFNYFITAESIAKLPYPSLYAYNWLDLIQENNAVYASSIVTPALINSPQLRSEINQAINKICLLPETVISSLVDAHMPAGGERFIELIKQRQVQLLVSALKNESFRAYLNSHEASVDDHQLNEHIKTFKTNGKRLTVPTLIENLNELLSQIQSHQVTENDVILKTYIDNMRTKIIDGGDDVEKLLDIKAELNTTLQSVGSEQVIAVKQKIDSLRSSYFLSGLKQGKADKIESALVATPLHERGQVISSENINDVQFQLAKKNRYVFRDDAVYKKDNKVVVQYASKSFKDLKQLFNDQKNQDVTTNPLNDDTRDQTKFKP